MKQPRPHRQEAQLMRLIKSHHSTSYLSYHCTHKQQTESRDKLLLLTLIPSAFMSTTHTQLKLHLPQSLCHLMRTVLRLGYVHSIALQSE